MAINFNPNLPPNDSLLPQPNEPHATWASLARPQKQKKVRRSAMKPKYHVCYESDLPGLESQIVSEPINFQDAHDLAIQLNAEAELEGAEQGYTVQPAVSGEGG